LGQALITGYQSHYVITSFNGYPLKETDFTQRKFNEIVINQEAQVVPIFLVEVDRSNFQSLMQQPYPEDIQDPELQDSVLMKENDITGEDDNSENSTTYYRWD